MGKIGNPQEIQIIKKGYSTSLIQKPHIKTRCHFSPMTLTEEGSLVDEGALGTYSRYCTHLLGGNWPRGGARPGLWVSLLPPCQPHYSFPSYSWAEPIMMAPLLASNWLTQGHVTPSWPMRKKGESAK